MRSPMHSAAPELIEPKPWRYVEGENRRERVLDPAYSPPRVVRHVGWRKCLACAERFWSFDVVKIRLCEPCKGHQINDPEYPLRRKPRTGQ
jgi:hypothetical protein